MATIYIIILTAMAVYALFAVLRRETRAGPQADAGPLRTENIDIGEIEREYAALGARGASVGIDAQTLSFVKEAMILPLGVPMDVRHASWEGTLTAARAKVHDMTIAERALIAIWTPGHIFTADDLLAELPGHEHDPIASGAPPALRS